MRCDVANSFYFYFYKDFVFPMKAARERIPMYFIASQTQSELVNKHPEIAGTRPSKLSLFSFPIENVYSSTKGGIRHVR